MWCLKKYSMLVTEWYLDTLMQMADSNQRHVRSVKEYSTNVAESVLKDVLGKKCGELSGTTRVATSPVLRWRKVRMAETAKFL